MNIKKQIETIRKRHQIQKILNQNGLLAIFNVDADDDEDWVTIRGTHVLIDENGVAQGGGKLKGMTFSNAKSTKKASKPKSKFESAMGNAIKNADNHAVASALKGMKTGDSFSYDSYGINVTVKKTGDDSYDYEYGSFFKYSNKTSFETSYLVQYDDPKNLKSHTTAEQTMEEHQKVEETQTNSESPAKESENTAQKPKNEAFETNLQSAMKLPKNVPSGIAGDAYGKALKEMKVGDSFKYGSDTGHNYSLKKTGDNEYILSHGESEQYHTTLSAGKALYSAKKYGILNGLPEYIHGEPTKAVNPTDTATETTPQKPKKKGLTKKAKEWATRFTQEAKDKAKWFTNKSGGYAAAKDYFSPVSESVYEKATKPQLAAEMEYTGTGSYYMNRVLAGFNGSYDMSNYKGYGGIDIDSSGYGTHIRQLTNLIKKSKYDHDVWLNSCQSYGWLNGLLGYQNEDITKMSDKQLQSYVGSTAKIPGFVSASIDKEKKFKSSPEVVANIYAPKGSEMFYTTRGEYGTAEHEMILQRGGSYKITKLEWGKNQYGKKCLYADLEIHPEDGYDTFQQTKKKS